MTCGAWRIELFGGLRIHHGDEVVTRLPSRKSAALLGCLALHLHQPQPREVLAEELWPDEDIDAVRHRLRTALSTLRHEVEPPGAPEGSVLVADRTDVGLKPGSVSTDVSDFDDAIRAAHAAPDVAIRAQCLADAVGFYRGELLPGYYENCITAERNRLEEAYFTALADLAATYADTGDVAAAIDVSARLVAADPLREDAHRQLMRLYATAGRTAEALRQYREMQKALREEVGVAPSDESQRLAEELRTATATPTVPITSSAAVPPSAEPEGEHHRSKGAVMVRPTGTITLLMVGISGTTALGETSADDHRNDTASRRALLHECVRRHDGLDISETDDVLVFVHGSAGDALLCAIACHRAVTGRTAPEVASTSCVRVAIHSGDVSVTDGQYRGPVFGQLSRMLTAAHMGQILCSDATACLVRPGMGVHTGLRDLGVYRLRDVPDPMRLYQVEYEGIAQTMFPAIRADAGCAHNLPRQYGDMVGRDQELRRVVEMLASDAGPNTTDVARLITLTGPGGTGKTRLAMEAASRLVTPYHGSVWFVPLTDVGDADRIVDALMGALRLSRSASADPADQVAGLLGREPALVVLDGFEHLVESGVPVVHALLERIPTLHCLVTSRLRLNLAGEREVSVLPLRIPRGDVTPEGLAICESAQLFALRAQAARPDFRVTASNAASVAALCDRLEGIPLAIELAAARAQVLTPAQMVSQLDRRLDFLVSHHRPADARHQTLRSAIAWSYRLLPDHLQRIFARLAIFRGGWTLEAAEAVCDHQRGAATLDALEQIRDSSLVMTDESGAEMRFRMLESLRAFAAECLSLEDRVAVERRHAEYFLWLAEEAARAVNGSAQAQWLARVEPELDNLRAALDWSQGTGEAETAARLVLAMSPVLYHRGMWTELDKLLREALDAAPTLPDCARALRGRLLCEVAAMDFEAGDLTAARQRAADADALFGGMGDQAIASDALNLLGVIALNEGNVDEARERFEAVLGSRSDHHCSGIALHNLAHLAFRRGDAEPAHRLYNEALAHRRAACNARGEAETLQNLGALVHGAGDLAEARRFYGAALAIYRGLRYPYGIAMMLNNLAEVDEAEGAVESAAVLYLHAERLLRDLRSRHVHYPAESLQRLSASLAPSRWSSIRAAVERTGWEQAVDLRLPQTQAVMA